MSFRTQRLVNEFPLWTKARRDASSLTQRLLDPFAEMAADQTVTAKKLSMDVTLLKPYLGIGYLHAVYLEGDDVFVTELVNNTLGQYIYPTVVGTLDSVEYPVTQCEDLITLLNSPPDRLVAAGIQSYSSLTVWSSTAPYTYTDPECPERLAIDVVNSTFFVRRTRVSDRAYSGRHDITVVGTDINDIVIREQVTVRDDGVYWTNNLYKTVTEVISEGFDGVVTIKWFPKGLSYEPDPYRIAVFDDYEGQLRLSLTTQVVNAVTYSYVVYSSARLKLGEQYRRVEIEATENVETLAEVVLLDSSNDPYIAVDLAINHQTSRLYVLDDQGSIHVYDHDLSPFSAFSVSEVETADTYIELVPLRHRAKYGDTEFLYTDFRRLRQNIVQVEIKRRSPTGTVEYLQADRATWAAGQAYIASIDSSASLPERSWNDFRFSVEYDELGQWEFVFTTKSAKETTVFVTAVMVDNLSAQASIDTGVSSPDGIGFSQQNYIGISDGSQINYYEEFVDGWLPDVRTDRVLMMSQYDSVEVTY